MPTSVNCPRNLRCECLEYLPYYCSDPVLLGYVVPGTESLQIQLPKPQTSTVAILSRDPITNAISIGLGPEWNNRLQASTLPSKVRLACRLSTTSQVPEEVPLVFFPLAGGRHVAAASVSVDPIKHEIEVGFDVDRLGADLVGSSMLSPTGMQGIAHFKRAMKAIQLRASLNEPHFRLATASRMDCGYAGAILQLRSEVEYPLWVDRVSYPTQGETRTFIVGQLIRARQILSVWLPWDFASIPPESVRLVIRPGHVSPAELRQSESPYPLHPTPRWSDEWHSRFAYMLETPSVGDNKECYVQIYGFRGFRFEDSGATVGLLVNQSSLRISLDGGYQKLHWIASPQSAFGYAFNMPDGKTAILLKLSRLAMRYNTQQDMSFVNEAGRLVFNVPVTVKGYDLDYWASVRIPSEAATIRHASEQASILAYSEIERLGLDLLIEPLAKPFIREEQRRLAQYLSSN